MSHSSLFPGFVKIRYSGDILTHFQTLPVMPSGIPTIGEEPTFVRNNDSTAGMDTLIDEYIALFKTEFGSGVTFVDAEFWRVESSISDPVWHYTYPIGVIGTAGSASVDMRQFTVSFRTGMGGNAFIYGMGCTGATGALVRENFPTSRGSLNTFVNYLIGSNGWVRGRDNGKLVTPIWWTGKNNDALRKKILSI